MERLIDHFLGKYHVLEELGRGGVAVVYKAYDTTLERYVAVKLLAPHLAWEQEFVQRFLREARAAAGAGQYPAIAVGGGRVRSRPVRASPDKVALTPWPSGPG